MLWSTIWLALREIRRNLMRSALTILGVVIGVAAVIAMVTLGGGATTQITSDISSLGSNLLFVRPGIRGGHGPGGLSANAPPFDRADLRAIAEQVPDVAGVAPAASRAVVAVYGNRNWTTVVTGTSNEFFAVRAQPLALGRGFSPGELRSGKLVCVIGTTVRDELFDSEDPLGASIRLGKLPCEVIGVLRSKGRASFGGSDQDDTIIVPLAAFHRRIAGNRDIQVIYVSARSDRLSPRVKRELERLMRERRGLAEGIPDDFEVRDVKEIVSVVERTTGTLTALLGAVAAISLLVGGIGIMNIMLVSVTERTREIGIRLAVGARGREVLLQFLVEAIVLSSLGGVVGVLLGLGLAVGGTLLLELPFVFDPFIVVLAFVFSTAVGIVFGFFPARRAAELNPIEALRHE